MAISSYLKALRERVGNELLFVPAVSAIIFNDASEVLLHQSSDDGNWYTIGGAMDPGEEPAEACVREVLEETGLRVVPERVVSVHTSPVVTYPNGDRTMYVGIAFRCRVTGGTLRVADDESLQVRYFPIGNLPPLRPDQRLRVLKAVELGDDGPTYFVPPGERA